MISFLVNGDPIQFSASPDTPLLWALRDNLGLTGTKYGCGMAQCGACTVIINGEAVRSCITPVSAVGGKRISTIEGLPNNAVTKAVREVLVKADDPATTSRHLQVDDPHRRVRNFSARFRELSPARDCRSVSIGCATSRRGSCPRNR